MAKAGGTSKTGSGLSVVGGDQRSGEDAELVELREALAAAGVPDDVVSLAMRGADTPEEVVARLIEAGVLPSPAESVAEMLAGWKPLLKRGRGSFDAELAGYEFLGLMRVAAPDADQMPDVLTGLIEQAEQHGGPEALVMLRVLAVVGPPTVAPVAARAADRLVEAGLTDPGWVAGLGKPVVGACFGYGDTLGEQESVTVTFSYGRKRHGVSVLIDHVLGGGVKDCWALDAPERVRAQCRQMAQRDPVMMTYREYTPAQAWAILDTALAAEPCPVEPDQVEDVGDYLDLVRARVALMANRSAVAVAGVMGPRRRKTGGASVGSGARSVHRVKITLRGARPPIWRRLEVPSRITLGQLHHAIQEAFGWESHHLWVFATENGEFGMPDRELGHRDAATTTLDEVAPRAGGRFGYTYDFGDDWEHGITVEDVGLAKPGLAYPRCVTGRRACPPEDCGGIWGYEHLLEILADAGHDEHAERVQWLGLDSAGEFDPAFFSLEQANKQLSRLATVLVKG
ncbi:MAG TPA: plasmid pRiA4b ORF-3 family protein [Pseudonocardiaceae bacterium]|nr:plasmid pRiA4b ORF-3 family protein [Pseudonocardiaceae bacterium]